MKALSIKQPWASLIASGEKTLEVRSWATAYRGQLVICASGRPSTSEDARAHDMLRKRAPRGVTMCIVDLVDVVPGTAAHAARTGGFDPTGFQCWVFDRPRLLEPRAVKGQLGLFELDDAEVVLAAVEAANDPLSLFGRG